MTRLKPALLALAILAPLPALAEGGDRMPAGGAFMSSYMTNPYQTRGPAPAFVPGGEFRPDVGATGSVAPRYEGPRRYRYERR